MLSATLRCAHGPAMLLETKGGTSAGPASHRWACSFTRDSAGCDLVGRAATAEEIAAFSAALAAPEGAPSLAAAALRGTARWPKPWRKQRKKMIARGDFCATCGALVAAESDHAGHKVVPAAEWSRPTELLQEQADNKSFAQFFFRPATVEAVADWVEALGGRRVVCLGAPRLHEHFLLRAAPADGKRIKSVLLDMDDRLEHFFPAGDGGKRRSFHKFNLTNAAFLPSLPLAAGGDDRADDLAQLRAVFGRADVLLCDPPFGASCAFLGNLLKTIRAATGGGEGEGGAAGERRPLTVMFFLPSFMKAKVLSAMPSLRMLDYEVQYVTNPFHQRRLRRGKKRKRGGKAAPPKTSPVRIFTNAAPLSLLGPPTGADSADWRLCAPCGCFRAAWNPHCGECGECTTVDRAVPMRHCSPCGTCVKERYRHCEAPGCGACFPPETHPCFAVRKKKRRGGGGKTKAAKAKQKSEAAAAAAAASVAAGDAPLTNP